MKTIINFMGTSSTGKTTLFKELEKNPQWLAVNGDEVFDSNKTSETQRLKPLILEKSNLSGMSKSLGTFMSEDEMVSLFLYGKMTLHMPDNREINHHFQSQDLPELEKVLLNAGFNSDAKLFELAKQIRLAAYEIKELVVANTPEPSFLVCNCLERPTFKGLVNWIHDTAFRQLGELDDGATVIVDSSPISDEDPNELFKRFKQKAEDYRNKHPDEELEVYNVLGICSFEKISERMLARNRKAELEGNPRDMRTGPDPLMQLGDMVTVERLPLPGVTFAPVSKTLLFDLMTSAHAKNPETDPKGSVLILENTIDPQALDPSAPESKIRIDSRETVGNFKKLTEKIGLVEEEGFLRPRPQLKVDFSIDMGKTPITAAMDMVQKIDAHRQLADERQIFDSSRHSSRSFILSSPTKVPAYPLANQNNNADISYEKGIGNQSDPVQEENKSCSIRPKTPLDGLKPPGSQ